MAKSVEHRPPLPFGEAVAYLGCTRRWLRRATQDGVIPSLRFRKLAFYAPDDLDNYITSSRRPARSNTSRKK